MTLRVKGSDPLIYRFLRPTLDLLYLLSRNIFQNSSPTFCLEPNPNLLTGELIPTRRGLRASLFDHQGFSIRQ